ncbi:MAG: hypothetical protein AAFZ63_15550 [Bacteroidota bacterium]
MVYLAVLAGVLIIGGLGLTSLITKNMAPSNKRLTMEQQRLKEDMDQWVGQLVPINKEELELFSLGQEKQVLRRGITTTAKGIYTTIYHEPVLAYSYREYIGKPEKRNALLYARTADHDFAYWIRKGVATLFIDGQEVGSLSREGVLRGKRTGKAIAERATAGGQEMIPVKVGNREVGSLSLPEDGEKKGLHGRAFNFLKPDLNDKEEQLFLALALEALVKEVVKE